MTEEQQKSISKMISCDALLTGKQIALAFFEKKMGMANAHVVDFRKSLAKDASELIDLVNECNENGALDELKKLV